LGAEIMNKFQLFVARIETSFTMAGDMRDAKATPEGEVNTN
jgi:hypothetical protein